MLDILTIGKDLSCKPSPSKTAPPVWPDSP